MLLWICPGQNKLIELSDVDRRHWDRPIGELVSIIHLWLWLWLWLWLCWLWLWFCWWWSSLVMMIADMFGQSGGLSSLTHSLTAAFDRFFDESTQLAYFLYKLCTLTLIDAFLSNVLAILENTWNCQSTSKQLNLPLLNRIQLRNFFHVHLYPIHKKTVFS